MDSYSPSEKFIALPVKLFHTPQGTIISRGCVESRIAGEGASNAIDLIFRAATGEGKTIEEICDLFDFQSEAAVRSLVQDLIARRFLVSRRKAAELPLQKETNADVFYWHFNTSQIDVARQLDKISFVIFGVNYISSTLVHSLRHAGVENIRVVDHSLVRNRGFFKPDEKINPQLWTPDIQPEEWSDFATLSSGECLIATSDSGNDALLLDLNRLCLSKQAHFLPILLRDCIGYIGPIVVPGHTACYECLRSRQNSHIYSSNNRIYEFQRGNSDEVSGFHPSMAAILGHLATVELTRFFVDGLPKQPASSLIEVGLLERQMTARKILKIPRCLACSCLVNRSQTNHRIRQTQETSRRTT